MLDRTIPFMNIIMRCDAPNTLHAPIPEGYRLRHYRPGDNLAWAALETLLGDFASEEEALAYFATQYDPEALASCAFFAEEIHTTQVVGSVIAWHDPQGEASIASLHWLVVHPAHEKHGIGSALIAAAMRYYTEHDHLPIYLHTQPWSHQAIRLYLRFGFRFAEKDRFAAYPNDYPKYLPLIAPWIAEFPTV